MKQFFVGTLVGACLSGSVALANNPVDTLPLQEQVDAMFSGIMALADGVDKRFEVVGGALMDFDQRLQALEKKQK